MLAVILLIAAACSDDAPAPATQDGAAASDMAETDEMAGDGGHHGGGHDTAHELAAEATMQTSHEHAAGDGHDHDHDHDHGSVGAPTQYDADVADAVQTIMVSAVGGAPEGGVRRVEVDLGSVVALMVTSDVAEEVHVHGYDILRAVSDGHPAHFAFNADIGGVFEVEFEGSGRLLLQLEIS